MSILRGIFKGVSLEKALSLCKADSQDSEILWADEPIAFRAIHEPEVKAVIVRGQGPDPALAAEAFDEDRAYFLAREIWTLNNKIIYEPSSSGCDEIPASLTSAIQSQARLLMDLGETAPLSVKGFSGPDALLHKDEAVTVHKSYAGPGLEFLPGAFSKAQVSAIRDLIVDRPDRNMCIKLDAGDTIIFKGYLDIKGSFFTHAARAGFERGLPHKGPSGIRDAQGKTRNPVRLSVAVTPWGAPAPRA